MTLSKRLYWIAGLVAVIALAFAAITLASSGSSAQTTPPAAADNQADGETNDDANGVADTVDDHADGETNDDGANQPNGDNNDNQADGETNDDGANQPNGDNNDNQADGETNDDNGAPADAGNLDDGKDLLPQASITIEQAIAAAKTAATGDIGEIDLEDYNGKLVFNVDVGDSDVKVDASNGAVLGSGSD